VKSALITGVSGQDGSYLAELLLSKGYRVVGTVRRIDAPRPDWFKPIASRIELKELDALDRDASARILAESVVDEVYHLAAQSHVGASWDDPVRAAEVSGMGTLHMLDAVRAAAPNARPRVLVAGSCEVYGRSAHVPQDEDTPHVPISPYGAAKSFAQRMTALYRGHYDLFASVAVLFNHESPRRAAHFVSQKIARGVAGIARGGASPLRLGSIDVTRDWGFAGDYVEAMWRILQADGPEDFVIGTGVGHTVREFAEVAFRVVGLDARQHVTIDQTLVRRDDAPALVADASRARTRLGWTPAVDFEQLVQMLVVAQQGLSSD
jgi:GDPmannose 4,6-dehydratase